MNKAAKFRVWYNAYKRRRRQRDRLTAGYRFTKERELYERLEGLRVLGIILC